jgi:zinc and cadmium transporter
LHAVIAAGAGVYLSIAAVSLLNTARLNRWIDPLVSVSTGVLLSAALLHLLPEAFDSQAGQHHGLFAWLLGGLLGFFMLEKLSLLRHSHHHEHDGHDHAHGYDAEHAGKGGVVILVGESIHNFADGLLVAGAFLVDVRFGWLTAFSIFIHSVPQHVGDFIVLLNAGVSRVRALVYLAASGLASMAGAFLGMNVLRDRLDILPFALVLAASSFLYIAVADLIPQMQRRLRWQEALLQCVLIAAGVLLISMIAGELHHHHAH